MNPTADIDYRAAAADKSRRRFLGMGWIGWTTAVVVGGGMLIAVLLPDMCRAREPANRVKCQSNLSQIGKAIALYAQENGGQFPPTLAVLIEKEDLTPAVFICPTSNQQTSTAPDVAGQVAELNAAETNAPGHKQCLSYVYVGQKLTAATAYATTVVAYEPLDNHSGDGGNVLFGDGHCEFVDKKAWLTVTSAATVADVTPVK